MVDDERYGETGCTTDGCTNPVIGHTYWHGEAPCTLDDRNPGVFTGLPTCCHVHREMATQPVAED